MTIEITPSIVIGLGGTGFDVVSKLSEEFYKTYGDVPAVQFLVIDTDKAGANYDKCPNFEFLHLTVKNPEDVLEGMRNDYYQEFKPWMRQDIDVNDLISGAKNNRVIGRFVLFSNIGKFRDKFTGKLQLVHGKNTNKNVIERGYKITKEMKVFIINSACGGSGSGMFIDIAYNIRHLLGNGKDAAISGYMITPDVFHKPETPVNMAGNSYAALKELDYYMNTKHFACKYDKKLAVEVEGKPFDYYYLLDSRSEDDHLILKYEDVLPIIMDAVKLEIASAIGGALDGRRTNQDAVLNEYFVDSAQEKNYIQAYGSFGTAAHYYPGMEFRALCSSLFTENLVEKFLGKPENFEFVVDSVYNVLMTPRLMGFSVEEMRKNLVTDHVFAEYPDEAEKKELSNALRKWKDTEVRSATIANPMENSRKQVTDALKKHINENMKSALNNNAQGLAVAMQIFEKFELQISGNNAALIGMPEKPGLIQQKETEIKNLEETCTEILKALEDYQNKRFPILHKRSIDAQRNLYISTAKDLFSAHIELLRLNATRSIYVELKEEAAGIYRKLERLYEDLSNMHARLKRENEKSKETLFTMKPTGTSSIIGNTEPELRTNYSLSRKSVDQVHRLICDEGLYNWLTLDFGQVSETLIRHGKEQYEDIKFDISRVIGNNLRFMLSDLYDDTHVRMTYAATNREFRPHDQPQYYILGVPKDLHDKCREIVSVLPDGERITVVATSDNYSLSYVTYKYGLPIIAMRPLIGLKGEYNMNLKTKPMHIFGNQLELPEIQ